MLMASKDALNVVARKKMHNCISNQGHVDQPKTVTLPTSAVSQRHYTHMKFPL
jgi:hypothetical protein